MIKYLTNKLGGILLPPIETCLCDSCGCILPINKLRGEIVICKDCADSNVGRVLIGIRPKRL